MQQNGAGHATGSEEKLAKYYTRELENLVEEKYAIEWKHDILGFDEIHLFDDEKEQSRIEKRNLRSHHSASNTTERDYTNDALVMPETGERQAYQSDVLEQRSIHPSLHDEYESEEIGHMNETSVISQSAPLPPGLSELPTALMLAFGPGSIRTH